MSRGSDVNKSGDGESDANTQGEHDPWNGNGGYTPLAELGDDSTIILSAGPGMEGAFYADISAFEYVEDNDNSDSHDDSDAKETKEEDADFREMADRALRALDEEYRATIQGMAERVHDMVDSEQLPPIRLLSEDFGSTYFQANFDGVVDPRLESLSEAERSMPSIDTDAVRRAVGAIRLNDSKLNENYASWEAQQKAKIVIAPKTHALIPQPSLTLFRKRNPSAIPSTATLSRAATIADALVKLTLLTGQDFLQIDVLGCDHVECSSERRLRQLFDPLICWISEYGEKCPKALQLHLIGPNVPVAAPRHVELVASGRLEKADLFCHPCVYQDRKRSDRFAQLLISFNAGIWGYNEWRPTLQHLAHLRQNVFFVVTAYTLEEADEDADVIQDEVSRAWRVSKEDLASSACIWAPQANAFASKQARETLTAAPGRCYRENAAWQAWRL